MIDSLDTILNGDLRFLFVGGKGGVGKTTTSSSLALHLATRRRVLLLSTDPAHSLSDAFNEPFATGTQSRVESTPGGLLDVLEINPREVLQEELNTWGKLAEEAGMVDSQHGLQEMKDWLCQAPGIDEAMAIASVIQRMNTGEYDTIVFDTAPTGHTLKLLQMPEIIGQLLSKLRSWQSQMWTYLNLMTQFSAGSTDTAASSSRQKVEEKLEGYRVQLDDVAAMMRDQQHTAFLVVCIAEHLSVQETKRLLHELGLKHIRVAGIVVNMLFPDVACEGTRFSKLMKARRRIQDKYLSVLHTLAVPVVEVLLQDDEITGAQALRHFSTLITQHECLPAQAPIRSRKLELNAAVEIHGLSKIAYNGLVGSIKSYDAATERYATRVTDREGTTKVLALRMDNLLLRDDLHTDPEILSFLQNPRLFEAYQKVLQKPSAVDEVLKDPELRRILQTTAEKMKPIM